MVTGKKNQLFSTEDSERHNICMRSQLTKEVRKSIENEKSGKDHLRSVNTPIMPTYMNGDCKNI